MYKISIKTFLKMEQYVILQNFSLFTVLQSNNRNLLISLYHCKKVYAFKEHTYDHVQM